MVNSLEGSGWAGECDGAGWEQSNQGGFLVEEDLEFSRPSPINKAKCMQKWVLVLLWVWPSEIMGTGVWQSHATAPQKPKLSFVIAQF